MQLNIRRIGIRSIGVPIRCLLFLLFSLGQSSVLGARTRLVTPYATELAAALATPTTVLAQCAKIGSSPALSVVRRAYWADYFARVHTRAVRATDRWAYFLLENSIAPFADRCYPLPPEEMPALYAVATAYAEKVGVCVPLFMLIDDWKLVDSCAASWNKETSFIVLTRGLIEEATAEQLHGAIAYQIATIANRSYVGTLKVLAPSAVGGFAALLCGVAVLRREELTVGRALACVGLLGLYGALVALVAAWLSKRAEYKADLLTARLDPQAGMALIELFERCHTEDFGGDINAARLLIKQLPHADAAALHDSERMLIALDEVLHKTESMQTVSDTGLFGSHRLLSARKAFFQAACAERSKE